MKLPLSPILKTPSGASFSMVPALSDYTRYQAGITTPEHYHGVYHLVFITSGSGNLLTENERIPFFPGDILVVDPGRRHIFSAGPKRVENFAFNFFLLPEPLSDPRQRSSDWLEQQCERTPFSELFGVPVAKCHLEREEGSVGWEKLLVEIDQFRQEVSAHIPRYGFDNSDSAAWEYLSAAFLIRLLPQLFPSRFGLSRGDAHLSDSLVRSIDRYLRTDLSRKYDLGKLSQHLRRSPAHVSNHFSKTVGSTIGAYFNRLRAESACKALRISDKSMSGISLDLGFSSPQHFSRAFREVMGKTPGEFRRESRIV